MAYCHLTAKILLRSIQPRTTNSATNTAFGVDMLKTGERLFSCNITAKGAIDGYAAVETRMFDKPVFVVSPTMTTVYYVNQTHSRSY